MKGSTDISRRLAENRAQICLLGLQEIQKYWRINNNILDLFLEHVDVSVSQRLDGSSQIQNTVDAAGSLAGEEQPGSGIKGTPEDVPYDFQTHAQTMASEDQYFEVLYGRWGGDNRMTSLWE